MLIKNPLLPLTECPPSLRLMRGSECPHSHTTQAHAWIPGILLSLLDHTELAIHRFESVVDLDGNNVLKEAQASDIAEWQM